MATKLTPSREDVKILISVPQALSISTTILRLIHRKLIHRLGWDDFWVSIAFISDLVLFITYLTYNPGKPQPNITLARLPNWLTLLSYTIALWTARLSISVTITRILPAGRMNFLSKLANAAFCAFGITLVIHKAYLCVTNQRNSRVCSIPRYNGIIELVTDTLADLWLILAPAYMLFQMKLRRSHHRLILGIFTCGIFTSFASIAHSVFILLKSARWTGITGHLQVTNAILVSNAIVLVTVAYTSIKRLRRRIRENRTARNISIESEQANSGDQCTTPDQEAPRDAPHYSDESRVDLTENVDLTEISSDRVGTFERRSISYLSVEPFSSFSYSTTPQSIPNLMPSSFEKSVSVPALSDSLGGELHAESGSLDGKKRGPCL